MGLPAPGLQLGGSKEGLMVRIKQGGVPAAIPRQTGGAG